MRSAGTRRVSGLTAAVVVACLLATATIARAAVTNSLHDFSTTGPYGQKPIDKGGVCTPCHSPHFSPHLLGGWPRGMTNEVLFYEQNGSSGADYIPGATLLCYDCHDDNVSADIDPDNADFTDPPQDIALGGTAVGYYENACGELPVGSNPAPTNGSPTGGHYWKSVPTGGPSSGAPAYARGDKIACSLCHDPHRTATGTNEAFFRTTTWDGSAMKALNDFNNFGTALKASTYNASTLPNGSRHGTGTGREMCAICHGYSDQDNQAFLYNVTVPKPPGLRPEDPVRIVEHEYDASPLATACVACHGHNNIAGCNECHGYPPLDATAFDRVTNPNGESYAGGAGAHRRHKDALAAVGSTIFDCALCHGPDPGRPGTTWHNESTGITCGQVDQANVDIMGLTSYWGAGSSYNGITSAGPPTYAFAAKGGSDGASPTGRCADLTCHGYPPASAGTVFLNWSDKMVDDSSGNFVGDGLSICKWCHDKTPAKIGTGPAAPNVLGDNDGVTPTPGLWTTATWGGADVNGHGKASGFYDDNQVGTAGTLPAANLQCDVCHDTRYTTLALPAANTPIKPHFVLADNDEKRLKGTNGTTINGVATADADAACNACHQNGSPSPPAGRFVSTHGNNFTGKTGTDFTRACRQCHDVHGANWNGTGRNLHMVGKWVDIDNDGLADAGEEARVDSDATTATASITATDLPVIFTANTGENSYDDGFGGPETTALHESVCVVCHVTLDPLHGPDNTVGSTRTRADVGTHNPIGGDCVDCHKHNTDTDVLTADAFAPSGCYGCHGTDDTEALAAGAIRRQFWPDGSPRTGLLPGHVYSDNQAGAHPAHITAIAWQLFEETPAQLVTDLGNGTGNGPAVEKQKTICAFCHFDPGGAGHSTNTFESPVGTPRANVYGGTAAGDWLRKFVPNAGSRAAYADNTELPPNGYGYGTLADGGTCANLICHNQTATPTGWNNPPLWAALVNSRCSQIPCHDPGTYTNAHTRHVGVAAKFYECAECHADNGVNLGHGNGEVDMAWNNAASLEGSIGADNGFYDKDNSGGVVPSGGDTAFAYKNTVSGYSHSCILVYCHGGDNAAWGGGDITPVWDNLPTATVYCGSCHDGNGTGGALPGGTDVASSGNHTDHLSAAYGPSFGNTGCVGTLTTGCHTAFDVPTITATHVDGMVQFDNLAGIPFSPLGTLAVAAGDATDTDRCSNCHSTVSVTANIAGPATVTGAGAALAKTNWTAGGYELPCLTCHNDALTAGTNFADGTGRKAPDMLGNDVMTVDIDGKFEGYGAEVGGHNRSVAAGLYPLSANPAARQLCTNCHDRTMAHINDTDDTTFRPGNRMLVSINGANPNNATQACQACHAVGAGASPVALAKNKYVNSHGNNGGAFLEPAAFSLQCMQCHDPHGMTSNGTGFNIQMISPTVTIAAGVTATGVRFEALTGANSFNDGVGADTEDICVVCHVNVGNPGFSMDYDPDGRHSATPGYSNDERGSNCSTCHTHNQDYPAGPTNLTTVDGFMPLECNACHNFPGKVVVAATHDLTPSHDKHVGRPTGEPALVNYGAVFGCPACHFQSSHNDRGLNVGDAWAGVTDAMVQVRFDNRAWPTGWNPATTLGATRNDDSADWDDGGNICSNLYCHGADTARFPLLDQGGDTTPVWGTASTGACGTCHRAGVGSVVPNPTTPPGTLAHPVHNGSGAGQYGIGCQVCHYGATNDGLAIANVATHLGRTVAVTFNEAADLRVHTTSLYNGDTVIGIGYGDCTDTYCHSQGTDLAAPYDGAADDPVELLDWDGAASCWSCHGNAIDSGSPVYADGTPKANKHPIHTGTGDPAVTSDTNGYGCRVCHWPTTHDNGTSIFTVSNHVNRAYDVDDDAVAPTLDEFTYQATTPGNCDNANCHGGVSDVSWGLAGPINCGICHARTAGVASPADVNSFHWDGTNQSKISYTTGGEYLAFGHGSKSSTDCIGCHQSAVGHDTTANLTGTNPFRLRDNGGSGPGGFTCSSMDTACHDTPPASLVRDHTRDEMIASGYAPQVDVANWRFTAKCVDCHDPHGDGTNLHMIQRELVEGSAANWVPTVFPPVAPGGNPALVFTDDTMADPGTDGTSYADLNAPYSSLCQECHQSTDTDFTSFKDGTSAALAPHPVAAGNPGDCSDCHSHASAFSPSGCEGCHNGDGDGDGTWTGVGYDPDGTGPDPAAPNVMGDGVSKVGIGTIPKPYDDGTWGYNVNGHGANGTAPNTPLDALGFPALSGDAICDDCHDISDPATGNGRHLNGILNSVELKQNPSTNTAHLDAPYVGTASPEWDVQLTFDNNCSIQCHPASIRHRHSKDAIPAVGAVRFGDKDGPYNGELIAYPIDSALSTNASTAERDFAPCISCHNPHGTNIVEPDVTTNHMLRANWVVPGTLCAVICHW